MASDGKITIDFDLNDKASEKLDEFTKKAGKAGEDSKEKMEKPFKDPIVAKLDAQAKKDGISNFKSLLKEIPEKQKTDLLAKAQKGEAIDFKKELKKIPNKVLAKVELNDNASAGLRKLQEESKKAETTFGSLRRAIGRGFKVNTASLDNANERLAKMNERVNKSGHLFGKVFGANVVSSAFINGLVATKSHLVGALKAGTDFNKEQQVMIATWNTLTGSADKGQEMVNSINSMAKAFGQSNDVVNELEQQFYHVFNQKEPTEKLTGSMLTLADTLGMNNEEVERLGLNFTHMMTSSKLQLGDFNMISDQLPMFGEKLLEYEQKLQKNSNLTMSQLRDQMSAGKISAEQATEVINELGDNYKAASENMLSTFTGMERRIKSQSHVLAGSITRPILETKNPLFKAVSDWVADDKTVKLFDNFGQQVSKSFNVITDAFGKTFKSKDFADFADHAMGKATKAVERFGNYVAKHSDDIIKLAKGIKAVGGAALSTGGMMMKIFVPMLMKAGELASKHKTTFKILAGTVLALGVAFKGTIAVMKGFTIINNGAKAFKALSVAIKGATVAQKALNIAMKASVIGLIVTAIAGLVLVFIELNKHNKKFKKFVGNFLKSAGKVFSDFGKTVEKVFKGVGKWFSGIGKMAGKAFNPLVKKSKSAFGKVNKHVSAFSKKAQKEFSGIGKMAGKAFNPLVKKSKSAFGKVNKHVSVFSKKAQKEFSGIGKMVGKAFNPLVKKSKSAFSNVKKQTSSLLSSTKKGFDGLSKNIGKSLSSVGKSIGKEFGSSMKDVKGIFKDTAKDSKSSFGDISKDVSGITKGITSKFKEVKKVLSSLGKWIKKIFGFAFKDAKKEFNNQIKRIKKDLSEFVKSFKQAFSGINKFLKQHKKEIQTVGKVISTVFKGIMIAALVPLGAAFAVTFAAIRVAISVLIAAIKPMAQTIANIFKTVIGVVSGVVKVITNSMKLVYHLFTGNFKAVGKDVGKIVGGYVKIFTSLFSGIFRQIGIFFSGIWDMMKAGFKTFADLLKPFAGFFKSIWKGIQAFFKPVIKWFEDVISDTTKSISNVWNSVWDGISSFFGGIWKGITKTTDSAIKGVKKVISDVLDTISGVWNGMWSGLGSFFGNIWDGIKQTAANGINFVIDVINGGIGAIDKVWKFFSGHETSIKKMNHVKFANGGIVGEQQMAMINDGGGSNWKELLEFPDGSIGMSEKRNHVLPLPTGTRVYNGEETKAIMEKAGIKKYANGGIVGSVIGAAKGAVDWTVDTAKGVGEWVGDKYDAVVKFLKDPLKNVTNMITGAISGIVKKMGNFADFATGAWKNMYSPIADWFKKGLKGIKKTLGRNAPAGSGVERWRDQVKDALKANGMSTESWAVNKILKQISTESGGNEKAVQGGYTDVNTKTGDLAKGLMQTISATFNRYAHPDHKNIFNGYDNLLAAIAYIKNRYGKNMSGIGEGHGYAEGGWANKPSIFGEVPGQPEVAINPSKQNADQLIVEAMQARAEKNPNGFSAAMLKMVNGVKSSSRPADGSLGVTSVNGSVVGKKSDSSQGNVNVSFNIDSTEVARKTYPMIKFLQNSDIQLNARTRGGSYGTL